MANAKASIVGVAIGAIAALAAFGTAKYIENEQQQIDQRKKEQISNTKLSYDPLQQNTISVLSHHGKFMSCGGANNVVHCRATKRTSSETFISIPVHNSDINDKSIKVALKTFDGKYISAQNNGTIQCNRENIGKWEIFTVNCLTDKKSGVQQWSFKSWDSKYLSAQWVAGKLIANRTNCDKWEKFIIQIVDWDDDDWE